jgi:hypothetical protein
VRCQDGSAPSTRLVAAARRRDRRLAARRAGRGGDGSRRRDRGRLGRCAVDLDRQGALAARPREGHGGEVRLVRDQLNGRDRPRARPGLRHRGERSAARALARDRRGGAGLAGAPDRADPVRARLGWAAAERQAAVYVPVASYCDVADNARGQRGGAPGRRQRGRSDQQGDVRPGAGLREPRRHLGVRGAFRSSRAASSTRRSATRRARAATRTATGIGSSRSRRTSPRSSTRICR